MSFFNRPKQKLGEEPPIDPPPYADVHGEHGKDDEAPPYSSHQSFTRYEANEYPEEKPHRFEHPPGGSSSSNEPYILPANNIYLLPPQQVNIAYETDGRHTRPGFKEYLENDPQRLASGHGPHPREAFGRKGAPLEPGHTSHQRTGGSEFPGSSKTTYYNAANK